MTERFSGDYANVSSSARETGIERQKWWEGFINQTQGKLEGPARAFLLALVLELGLASDSQAQSQANGNKSEVSTEVYADSQQMYEAWLRYKSEKGWTAALQAHTERTTKVDFVAALFGKNVKAGPVNMQFSAGPQVDLNQGKVSHVAAFGNVGGNMRGLRIQSFNRLAVPVSKEYPFAHRHVQSVSGGKLPQGVSIQAEERHIKKWDELKVGAAFEFNIPGGKGKVYGYYDQARKGGGFRFVYSARVK